MALKFCEKCHHSVEQYVMECPKCESSSFLHQDPTKSAEELELEKAARDRLRSMTPSERKATEPDWNEKAEIAKLRLAEAERAMAPEKLAAFKKRFQNELLELEYRKWRALQPGWTEVEVQQRKRNIGGTAATAAIGSAIINSQIRGLHNEISSDGEDGGGVMDWFGGLFD